MRTIVMLMFSLVCVVMSVGAQVHPSGGRADIVWRPGTAVDVSWSEAFAAGSVDIELYDANRRSRLLIARGVDGRRRSTGVVLPDSLRPGKHYVLFVRDAADASRYLRSAGYIPVEAALARAGATDVAEVDLRQPQFFIAPNPTMASAVLTWDMIGVRRVRVSGADGVVRLEKDVEATDRRLVLPSDKWLSGTYVVELISSTHVVGRSLMVVVH